MALAYKKDGFQAGLSACNLGTPVNYGGDNYAQPGIARAGAAYSLAGFTASAELDYLFSGALMFSLGYAF